METLDLRLDGDGAWPELKDIGDKLILSRLHGIARLPMGMVSGKSSVALRIICPTAAPLSRRLP